MLRTLIYHKLTLKKLINDLKIIKTNYKLIRKTFFSNEINPLIFLNVYEIFSEFSCNLKIFVSEIFEPLNFLRVLWNLARKTYAKFVNFDPIKKKIQM